MENVGKILVVDDEKSICENVEKILTKNNFQVIKAQSAKEALEKMASESISLLISDIVMPQTNGLELLKLVKKQWPFVKVLMITAYASIDTAVKAIRLGALDYLPKPFTPDELRSSVTKALSGELAEAPVTEKERETIDPIDVDIPFDKKDVEKIAGQAYVDTLGPSDMPVVEAPAPETLENYCAIGARVCDIFKKIGNTCKAGLKTSECPKNKAKAKKAGARKFDPKKLIGIDEPFNYQEVVGITGPEYVENLHPGGFSFLPYEQLKHNVGQMIKEKKAIDRDIPFETKEVVDAVAEQFVEKLGPSDMPVVEGAAPETLENYCDVGAQVCDIFKKLGSTCKAGAKTGLCPRLKKAKKGAGDRGFDARRLIAVDMPFDAKEVEKVTGPEYLMHLERDGTTVTYYDDLKRSVVEMMEKQDKKQADLQIEDAILVIDDEPAVNNNIRKILAKRSFEVDQALTKEQALDKISKRYYRVILLDLKIPGVKGLELLQAIKEIRPLSMVIIITGYASIETAVETARLGAIDYVAKPFTPTEIREATQKAFELAA